MLRRVDAYSRDTLHDHSSGRSCDLRGGSACVSGHNLSSNSRGEKKGEKLKLFIETFDPLVLLGQGLLDVEL